MMLLPNTDTNVGGQLRTSYAHIHIPDCTVLYCTVHIPDWAPTGRADSMGQLVKIGRKPILQVGLSFF